MHCHVFANPKRVNIYRDHIVYFLATKKVAKHGFSRVRPAVLKISRVDSGPVKKCGKSHVSGRVGSGRVRRFPNLTGLVGSR